DVLPGNQLRQIFPALLFGAVAPDLVDAEVGVRAVRQTDRRRAARDFLHRHAMGEIAEAGAAVLLLDGDAVQAERTHLRPQIAREGVALVDLIGARRNLVIGKAARGLAQHVDVLAKPEIEALPSIGDHARSSLQYSAHYRRQRRRQATAVRR